jgi:hypothetical protein
MTSIERTDDQAGVDGRRMDPRPDAASGRDTVGRPGETPAAAEAVAPPEARSDPPANQSATQGRDQATERPPRQDETTEPG